MAADDLIEIFAAHLRAESKTARTVYDYTYICTKADQQLPYGLDCATEDELRAYLWRGDYAPASRALRYAAIKAFFTWAVDAEYLDFDPTRKIARPKVRAGVPRVAADDIARMVLTEAKEPHRLHAQLAAYAGARDRTGPPRSAPARRGRVHAARHIRRGPVDRRVRRAHRRTRLPSRRGVYRVAGCCRPADVGDRAGGRRRPPRPCAA